MTHIAQAILALDPTAQVSVNAEDVNQITWHDGNPNSITVAQIQTKQTELQTAYDAQAYARTRADAYPSIQDFMEAYTEKEIDSNSAKWDAYVINRNKVRTDNPK
jgi:hypothetical protein